MSRSLVAAALLACAAAAPSHATDVSILPNGGWYTFNVSDIDAQSGGLDWIDNANSLSPDFGSALTFSFVIAAGMEGTLTVVDAGFAGDSFELSNFGRLLGSTSAVAPQAYVAAPDAGTDFSAALADSRFSRAQITLGAGAYSISGRLLQSVSFEGLPLNSTVGGLRVSVSPVPEPHTYALLLAGLAAVGFVVRRRRA